MKMGKVFYVQPGGAVSAGWFYSIDLAQPQGPFDTKIEAASAARETEYPSDEPGRLPGETAP